MERLRPSIMTVVTSPSYTKELQYRKALNELVSAMIKDIADTFSIPRVAQDAKTKTLAQTMKELRNRWHKNLIKRTGIFVFKNIRRFEK